MPKKKETKVTTAPKKKSCKKAGCKSPGKSCKSEVKAETIEAVEQLPIITGSERFVKGGIPRKKKVSIVGFAPSSMRDVVHVWDDPDMEVWGLNQLYMPFPEVVNKATRWFQIHHKHTYDQTVQRDHSHHEWMSKQDKFLIYMQKVELDIPFSVEFPVEMLLKKFRRYFTNSISWMVALAIHEGFEEISIFGVDMATDSEYEFERPSCEYFIGYAEGRGIKVIIPEKSDLLKSMWLYPFEDTSPMKTKFAARRQELRQRVNVCSQHEQQMHDERLTLIGALENMNYIEKAFVNAAKEQVVYNELPGK